MIRKNMNTLSGHVTLGNQSHWEAALFLHRHVHDDYGVARESALDKDVPDFYGFDGFSCRKLLLQGVSPCIGENRI